MYSTSELDELFQILNLIEKDLNLKGLEPHWSNTTWNEISSDDVYEELRPHTRAYFDFSNYPESHMLKNICNKKVPGKFKDESASKCITEFVGLRRKMYSFMLDDKNDVSKAEVRVAKGVQKSVIFNNLRFSTYLNCL